MNAIATKLKTTIFRTNEIVIVFAMISAIISGIAIVNGKWLYVGVLFIMPFIIYICVEKPFIFPFGLYVFSIPFDSVLVMTGSQRGPTFTKLCGVLTILIFIFKGLFENKLKKPDSVVIWWTLFVLYGALSRFWAINPDTTLSLTTISLLIFYLVVASYKIQKSELETLKWFILAGGLLAAIYTSYNSMTGYTMDSGRGTLMLGNYTANPNTIAFGLLIPLSICVDKIIRHKSITMKCLYVIVLGIILTTIVITGSRSSMLGVATIFIIYIFSIKKKISTGIIMVAIGLIAISLAPDLFIDRWSQAVETRGSGRVDIWFVGLEAIKKYWVLGAGNNNFPNAYNEFIYLTPQFIGYDFGSHNQFLGLLVELGIFGFSLFVLAIIKHSKKIHLQANEFNTNHIILKAALGGILVSSFFGDNMLDKSFWLLWMMILMNHNVITYDNNFMSKLR